MRGIASAWRRRGLPVQDGRKQQPHMSRPGCGSNWLKRPQTARGTGLVTAAARRTSRDDSARHPASERRGCLVTRLDQNSLSFAKPSWCPAPGTAPLGVGRRADCRDHGPAGDHGGSHGRAPARTAGIKNQCMITDHHAGDRLHSSNGPVSPNPFKEAPPWTGKPRQATARASAPSPAPSKCRRGRPSTINATATGQPEPSPAAKQPPRQQPAGRAAGS
jgi:hypothetical protein